MEPEWMDAINVLPCRGLPTLLGTLMMLIAMDTNKCTSTYYACHLFNSYGMAGIAQPHHWCGQRLIYFRVTGLTWNVVMYFLLFLMLLLLHYCAICSEETLSAADSN